MSGTKSHHDDETPSSSFSSSSSRPPPAFSLEDSARRILRTTGISASTGAALGLVMALRNPPRALRQVLSSSSTGAASLGMLGLSFSAAKEYTRSLTGTDSSVNSAVGGAAAGGLLFASHGGNPVLGAALVAALGATVDVALARGGVFGVVDGGVEEDGEASWWALRRWVRETSDEERSEFLEKRRKRIKRIVDDD